MLQKLRGQGFEIGMCEVMQVATCRVGLPRVTRNTGHFERVDGYEVLQLDVAVGKTPGEPAGSPVRVGSENGHLVRRTQAVRREGVVHDGSEVHLRKRAARFLERLFPTATSTNSTARVTRRRCYRTRRSHSS